LAGSAVLAIDAGNSGCRSAVIGPDGTTLSFAQREWARPMDRARPGVVEIDLVAEWQLIESAVAEAVARAPGAQILAIGVAAARSGLVVLDRDRRAVAAFGPLDRRASAIVDRRRVVEPGWPALLRKRTGQPVGIAGGPRLAWLREDMPEILEGAAVLTLTGWLVERLTGEAVAEKSSASTIGLLELSGAHWDADELARWSIDPAAILPRLAPSEGVVGRVRSEIAATTGVPPSAVVIAGGGDTQLSLLAVDAVDSGATTVVGGSYWQVVRVLDRPLVEDVRRMRTTIHVVSNRWLGEALVVAPGLAARWFRDAFGGAGDGGFSVLTEAAAAIPPGSMGAVAILASGLDGWSPAPTPLLVGLPMDRPDLAGAAGFRAILESAALESSAALTALDRFGPADDMPIRIAGGVARNGLWLRILADVTGRPIAPAAGPGQSLLGAAMLASIGAGIHESIEAARPAMVRWGEVVEPDGHAREAYDAARARWRAVLDRIGPSAD
jgi:sugar (pentulose or hexulose) kinase